MAQQKILVVGGLAKDYLKMTALLAHQKHLSGDELLIPHFSQIRLSYLGLYCLRKKLERPRVARAKIYAEKWKNQVMKAMQAKRSGGL